MWNQFKNYVHEAYLKSYNKAKARYEEKAEEIFQQYTLEAEGPSALFARIKNLEEENQKQALENSELKKENLELQKQLKYAC